MATMGKFIVADNKSRDIDSQIAVTPDQSRKREREKDKGKQKNGVERCIVLDVDTIDCKDRQTTDAITQCATHSHLNHKLQNARTQTNTLASRGYHRHEYNGEHICHRVVTTTLQLEQRT